MTLTLRRSIGQRLLAVFLVMVLLAFCVIQPPRADALAVSTAAVAAFILVAAAMGISFVASDTSSLESYISSFLSGFTSSSGYTIADMVISWATGGMLRLGRDEAVFLTEAVVSVVQAEDLVLYSNYLSIDGFNIDTVSSDGSIVSTFIPFWDLSHGSIEFGSYFPLDWYPSFSYVLAQHPDAGYEDYILIKLYDGQTLIGSFHYVKTVVAPKLYFTYYNGVLRYNCNPYPSWGGTITGALSQYVGLLYDSAVSGYVVSALGDINTQLADMAAQINVLSEELLIATVLTPSDVISDAQAGTLVVPEVSVEEKTGEGTGEDTDENTIVSSLTRVFVPSKAVVQEKIANLTASFENRFGILTYPASVLFNFTGRIMDLEEQEPIFRWNDIYLQGVVVIPAGQYNLRDATLQAPFSTIYTLYRLIISALLVFQFLNLCHKKYNQIIHGGASE